MKSNKNEPRNVICGERLRKLRKREGLTLDELAEKIGQFPDTLCPNCSGTHLGYLERGDRKISEKYVFTLSRFFKVRPEYIRGYDPYDTEENLKAKALTQHFINERKKVLALEQLLKVYDMTFEFDIDNINYYYSKSESDNINAMKEAQIRWDAEMNNPPDAYSLKNDKGEEIASCTYSEYNDLVEELHDFIFYKINRIIQKHNPAYLIKE
jgi:transcriptional regulator with XRE-family HTH domain